MLRNGHREAAATSISTLFAVFFRSFFRLRVDSVGVWNKCGKVFTSIMYFKLDHFNFVLSIYPEFRRYFSSFVLNTAFFSWDRLQHFNRVPNLYINAAQLLSFPIDSLGPPLQPVVTNECYETRQPEQQHRRNSKSIYYSSVNVSCTHFSRHQITHTHTQLTLKCQRDEREKHDSRTRFVPNLCSRSF